MLGKMAPQQRLSLRDAVLTQRGGGGHQTRVTRGRFEKARTRSLSPRIVSHRRQVIGEGPPRVGKIRIELYRLAELRYRILAPAESAEGQTEFEMRRNQIGRAHV